ncbi:hypothetical protein N3K66_007431 [Trichothecium roseum]|uniref:Uncharacterized protein n=1 Tax=Trichothecium roseum TaxID=47278 RepID=A0ACC0UTW8_9HYPO|nr:hypothetical protein N3K66_007431 [Trichothecium roseum]
MSAQQGAIDTDEVQKLNAADKEDLRKFIVNEQQRSNIQAQTHELTQMCWKKCVTGNIKSTKLDKGEETCLANCVDRFLDLNFLTMKHLSNMRGQ